jgi:hypothetical protein
MRQGFQRFAVIYEIAGGFSMYRGHRTLLVRSLMNRCLFKRLEKDDGCCVFPNGSSDVLTADIH